MAKTILITGSSRGIGASLAILAKKEGYNVILHGKSYSKNLRLISKKLKSQYLFFDLNNDQEMQQAIKSIKKIDILINSVGINISKTFTNLTLEDWRSVYDCNIFGVVNLIRSIMPILNKPPFPVKIINIASVKGTYSAVGHAAYASSKAALINLTTALAKEFSPNILVNSVSPGFISTEMTKKTWSKRIKKQVDTILLKRIAKPEEIANVILFLCSDKCTYMTGQNIIVDGGFGIKHE